MNAYSNLGRESENLLLIAKKFPSRRFSRLFSLSLILLPFLSPFSFTVEVRLSLESPKTKFSNIELMSTRKFCPKLFFCPSVNQTDEGKEEEEKKSSFQKQLLQSLRMCLHILLLLLFLRPFPSLSLSLSLSLRLDDFLAGLEAVEAVVGRAFLGHVFEGNGGNCRRSGGYFSKCIFVALFNVAKRQCSSVFWKIFLRGQNGVLRAAIPPFPCVNVCVRSCRGPRPRAGSPSSSSSSERRKILYDCQKKTSVALPASTDGRTTQYTRTHARVVVREINNVAKCHVISAQIYFLVSSAYRLTLLYCRGRQSKDMNMGVFELL